MAHLPIGTVLQHLRRVAARQQEDELSDGQLLERFAQRRDEAAFAALLRRHGPMVLSVCRSILRHLHDVEDAFQATFLILAQKAGCIRRGDSVGGWLHEVAHNVALKARTRMARREACERKAGGTPAMTDKTSTDPLDDLTVRELRQALHEELRQLPEKYRLPLILCYLEGKTQEEAARQLGWPHRRVQDRLQRGREQLRRRLHKRGLAPVAALGTALFAADEVSATVPAVLIAATLRSAVQATPVAPAVAALVEAGGAFASTSKVKAAMVLLLAVSLLSGAAVCFLANSPHPQGQLLLARRTGGQTEEASHSPKRETAKNIEIQGRVLGPDDKPRSGAKILLLGPLEIAEQQELLVEGGKVRQLGVSAADGRFTVAVAKAKNKWERFLVAQSEDSGIDIFDAHDLKPGKPIELRLVKDQVIRGRIVNTEGKPVASVGVAVNHLGIFPNNSLDSFLAFWKNRPFDRGLRRGDKEISSGAGELSATTTDASGRFTLHGVGAERLVSLRPSGGGIATTEVWIVNRAGFDPKPYNQATLDNIPKGQRGINHRWMLSGPEVSVVAEAEKIIRGKVTAADTGKGRPGVVVRVSRKNGSNQPGGDGDYLNLIVGAKTDAQGRYEIHGVHKAKSYLVRVESDTRTGYLGRAIWVEDTPGYRPVTADLRVRKGVIVTGRITDKATGKPLEGSVMIDALKDNPYVKEYSDGSLQSVFIWTMNWRQTDANGVFRDVTIPGSVLLMGASERSHLFKNGIPDPEYPRLFTKFQDIYTYRGSGTNIVQGSFCKVLQIKPDVAVVRQDIVLERKKVQGVVKIQDAEGRPLLDVDVCGAANEVDGNSCTIYGQNSFLIFHEPKRKLAAALTLKAGEKLPSFVKLRLIGSVKGRLLDVNGKPLAGIVVAPRYNDRMANRIDDSLHEDEPITSAENGIFTLDSLIPGLPFELSFREGRRAFERAVKAPESVISLKIGERREVGAIRVNIAPAGSEDRTKAP